MFSSMLVVFLAVTALQVVKAEDKTTYTYNFKLANDLVNMATGKSNCVKNLIDGQTQNIIQASKVSDVLNEFSRTIDQAWYNSKCLSGQADLLKKFQTDVAKNQKECIDAIPTADYFDTINEVVKQIQAIDTETANTVKACATGDDKCRAAASHTMFTKLSKVRTDNAANLYLLADKAVSSLSGLNTCLFTKNADNIKQIITSNINLQTCLY